MSLPDALEKAVEEGGNRFTAIYIAVLAVLLAICSVGGDNASKDAMSANIVAADTYAFFQAKNIRQTDYELAADGLELRLLEPGFSEEAKKHAQAKLAAYRAKVAQYESEPKTGEGKKELLAKAAALVAQRDLALQRDPYFDMGQGLLQIAIVLASASLIIGGTSLLWISWGLGVLGALSMLNAFTLIVTVPFMS